MKVCKQCEGSYPEENFYRQVQRGGNGQGWEYRDSYCIPCRKQYTQNRRDSLKQQSIDYLGGKCKDCGIIDDPAIYDFHHEDPTKKEFSFGQRANLSFEKLRPELDKCTLLCANCHRKRHRAFPKPLKCI